MRGWFGGFLFVCCFRVFFFSFSQVLQSLGSTEPPEIPLVSAIVILLTEVKKRV